MKYDGQQAEHNQNEHKQLMQLLAKASKERLIIALRVLVTNQAWKQDEEELRAMLYALAHAEDSSHAEVIGALSEENAS